MSDATDLTEVGVDRRMILTDQYCNVVKTKRNLVKRREAFVEHLTRENERAQEQLLGMSDAYLRVEVTEEVLRAELARCGFPVPEVPEVPEEQEPEPEDPENGDADE